MKKTIIPIRIFLALLLPLALTTILMGLLAAVWTVFTSHPYQSITGSGIFIFMYAILFISQAILNMMWIFSDNDLE